MLVKKRILIMGLALALVLVGGYLAGFANQSAEISLAEEEASMNTISVRGDGVIKIKPDVAYISIGVETENIDSQKAQEENGKKMQAIMNKLKSENIKDRDIKTTEYNIITLRKYNEKSKQTDIYGYRVINVVQVTINDIDKVGKIIDLVSQLGANYIRNIRFGTSKQDEYYLEALTLAMKNAENKANAVSNTFDVKLIKPYKVIENSSMGYMMRDSYANMKTMAEESYTPISQGELEIRASVSVTYKY